MKLIDLTGKKFGRLTVLSRADVNYNRTKWNCLCECGTEKIILGCHLKTGKTISCGCSSRDRIGKLNLTHGMSKSRIYNVWANIKTRCYNNRCKSYKNYGGRGITMCDEWNLDFDKFYNWAMKNGYDDKLSIDRIDVNGNYQPDNCRWATHKEQSNNTRRTIKVKYNNTLYSMKELSEMFNIKYWTMYRALEKNNYEIDSTLKYLKILK